MMKALQGFAFAVLIGMLCGCAEQKPHNEETTIPVVHHEAVRETVQEQRVIETPGHILYCKDPSLEKDEQELLFTGQWGAVDALLEVVYVDGDMRRESLISAVPLRPATPAIVAVGTGEQVGQNRRFPLEGDGFIVTATGECLHYTRKDTYNATAYTSWIADVTGTTACGTPARVGAVAVDPAVIPYYTKMYIVSEDGEFDYGIASAEDCGGAVKGKIIDLFFDSLEECYAFGRRDITVYFLSE